MVKTVSVTKRSDYISFLKIRLATLVVFSAAITYILAMITNNGVFKWLELMAVIVGGFLITGASNGLNQIKEKELDRLMTRTQNRPLPTDRMTVKEAWIIAISTGFAGVGILCYLNLLTGLLGLISLILYAWIYTPLKQKTSWSVFVGAFPGALPPMIGWIAYTGEFGPAAFSLFALQFIWQFPHFWAIAWRLDEDYKKAGFIMLPSGGEKNKQSAFQILFYTIFMIPISLIPMLPMFNVGGILSVIAAIVCGVIMLKPALKLYQTLDDKYATKLMFASFLYLPVILIAMVIDKLYLL